MIYKLIPIGLDFLKLNNNLLELHNLEKNKKNLNIYSTKHSTFQIL